MKVINKIKINKGSTMKTVFDRTSLSASRRTLSSLHSVLPSAVSSVPSAPCAFIGFAGLWSHTHSLRTS